MENIYLRRALKIQQEVLKLNEGLNYYERQEQLKFFNMGVSDALLEENFFKKREKEGSESVDKVIDKGKGFLKNIVGKGKEMYDKGRKMGGNIVDWVKDLGGTITKKLKEIKDKVTSDIDVFVLEFKEFYDDFKQQIVSGYEKIKDNIEKSKQFFENLWVEMKNPIIDSYNEKMESLIKNKDSFVKWFPEFIKKCGNFIKSVGFTTLGTIIWSADKVVKLFEFVSKGENWKLIFNFFVGFTLYIAAESFKSVQAIYDFLLNKIKGYINDTKESLGDFLIKLGEKVSETGKKMVDSSKTDEIKDKYKELLSKWREEQKKAGKTNMSPGEGTRKKLKRQAAELVGESRVITCFESFIFINE